MARTLYDRLNEIKTKHLSPQSVTGEKIASNSIEEKHLKDGSVTRDKIADKIVGTDEIIDGAVTKPKIAKNAVSSDAIIGGAVTTEKIADNSVNASKIASGAITTEKIANGAITRDKVADRSVGTDDLVDGSVTTAKLATSSVTKIKLASNSVGYLEIINGSVEPRHIRAVDTPANGEVPSYNQAQERFEWVAPGGGGVTRPLTPPVATDEIADGAVTSDKIGDGEVPPKKLTATTPPSNGQLPSYDEASGKFLWVTPSGGAKFKTGTYTGNGNSTQAITGVGFQPKFVLIYDHTLSGAPNLLFKTDQDGLYAFYLWLYGNNSNFNYATDVVVSLDADGFTVGNSGTIANTSGNVYTYIAFG